jgi:hypothetical protein
MAGEFVTERLSSVFNGAEKFWWLKILKMIDDQGVGNVARWLITLDRD